MKNQFINMKPAQDNPAEQQKAKPGISANGQKEMTSGKKSLLKAPFELPSLATEAPPEGYKEQQNAGSSQFKHSFSPLPATNSEGGSKPYNEQLSPTEYRYGQGQSDRVYAPEPPAMSGPGQPGNNSFKNAPRSFASGFAIPPGFAPGTSVPQTDKPWSIQAPDTQTPYTRQEGLQWHQPVPVMPPQAVPWQNSPMPPPSVWQNNLLPPAGSQPLPHRPYTPGGQPDRVQNTPLPIPQKNVKKRTLPIWSRVLLVTLVTLLVIGGGGFAYYQANYASSISNITNQQVVHHNNKGEVVQPTQAPMDVLTGNRLNILLLGSDTDGKSVPLAQTDIIITIDPQTKYVGMLSIPRDLRLYAPKAGAIKLDEAFATGWALPGNNNYGNAVGLSIDTIEQNFGIPINYSAWVGLDGFVKVIDTAGGIDVDVLHPMVDDIYPNDVNNKGGQAYDYKRLYIAPGPQHLDGIHALEYVRTRHSDGQADFGRAVRQQQILSQLKTKLAQIDINSLPQLIQDLNGHVKTDMQLTDIPKLMNFARGIDLNKIDKLVLSAPYSVPASSVYPKDTSTDYIPVCSQIIPKIQQMFNLGDKATCPKVGARYTYPQASAAPTTNNQFASITPRQEGQAMTTASALQMLGGSGAPLNSMSLPAIQSKDPLEVHNLLDLMLVTVFQTLAAART